MGDALPADRHSIGVLLVVAVCPGYTAAEVEEQVAKPLEEYIWVCLAHLREPKHGHPVRRAGDDRTSLERLLRQDDRVVSVASFKGCASLRFQNSYAPQMGGQHFAQFIVNANRLARVGVENTLF